MITEIKTKLQNITLRNIIQVFAYYLIPVFLLIISILKPEYETFRFLGKPALYLLIIVMFIKPLSIIFELTLFRIMSTYRREMGVTIFWFALLHSAGIIYTQKLFNISYYYGFTNFLFWGIIGTMGMTILGLTSNVFSVKLLKQNWKKLQKIAYIAFIATLLHVGLMKNKENIILYSSIILIYIILKIVEKYLNYKKTKTLNNTA